MKLPSWVLPASAVFFCAACTALLSPVEYARTIAESAGMIEVHVPDPRVKAYAQRKPGVTPQALTVYIESDGAPWITPHEPPADPTPIKPLALHMAIADPAGAVAYLGRPCQYLVKDELRRCDPELWMRARFSEDALTAMNQAVDAVKAMHGASQVRLVGYSGGGTVAALLAQRRNDVACLVTVAAPLDTTAWTQSLKVSPLAYSLNPADRADTLRDMPQTHFRGTRDKLVMPDTTRRFVSQVRSARVIDKDFDHRCCWDERWKELWRESCLSTQ